MEVLSSMKTWVSSKVLVWWNLSWYMGSECDLVMCAYNIKVNATNNYIHYYEKHISH